MLQLASVTDSVVTAATHVIRDLGLGGVFVLMAADAMGIPIAAAAVMLFAGFEVSEGHLTLLGVIVAGTLGDVAGSCVAYAIGATGGHELLERHGRRIHITPARIERAHGWFERHGARTIAVARLVPFVRTYIGYPAGVARMDLRLFVLATAVGGAVLCVAWAFVGRAVGNDWTQWKHALGYVDYAVLALALAGAAWAIARRNRRRARAADAPA